MSFVPLINSLIIQIQNGKTLTFQETDWSLDELIKARDSQEFEKQWLSIFQSVEARASELSDEENRIIDNLREVSYKKAYSQSECTDIAAFVSDDMELIARIACLGTNSPWVNALWMEYKQGRFPYGELREINGELPEMLSLY